MAGLGPRRDYAARLVGWPGGARPKGRAVTATERARISSAGSKSVMSGAPKLTRVGRRTTGAWCATAHTAHG